MGDQAEAPRPLRREDGGDTSVGAVMITNPRWRDQHGYPYQVLVEFDVDDTPVRLVADQGGRILVWALTADGDVMRIEGENYVAIAPEQVAREAAQWLNKH